MPHELLLEISQYLGPPFDFVTPLDWSINQMYSDGILVYLINSERRRTLHSLSQCCRALRSFFLPLAWEYFDACCTKDDHQACIGWKPPGSPNLELKCEGLVENPNLAAYVRYEMFFPHHFALPIVNCIIIQCCKRALGQKLCGPGPFRPCTMPAVSPKRSHPAYWEC